MTTSRHVDVAIVGGGPAGLQAALTLARARRSVAIVDAGHPRNAASRHLRGFLSRDGILPGELLRLGRLEALEYPQVTFVEARVDDVHREETAGIALKLSDGSSIRSRKLLLAMGVADVLPDIPGVEKFYGNGVYHCPYCDGFEYADQRLAVYGKGRRGFGLAKFLLNWSRTVILLTHGRSKLSPEQMSTLQHHGVEIHTRRIDRLTERNGRLTGALFTDGWEVKFDALFFNLPSYGKSHLAEKLGIETTRGGAIRTQARGKTSVPGVYAAGNVLKDVMLSIVAAGQGCEAAFEIVGELVAEDYPG